MTNKPLADVATENNVAKSKTGNGRTNDLR